MASQLDATFFRKAKKANRAIEILDHEAVIPAVKDKAEIRVKLPNRRHRTPEERRAAVEENLEKIRILDEQIEVERKNLLSLVEDYRASGAGVSDVVAMNLKVQGLVERRSSLVTPQKWIEEIPGLTLKDVFASKRDVRKIGSSVYQIKRRVEPIESLYVDVGSEQVDDVSKTVKTMQEPSILSTLTGALGTTQQTVEEPKTQAEQAQGAIIGQKRILKTKKAQAAMPASGATFS